MYWIQGKAQFTKDENPKVYARYGPFSEITVAEYALQHIQEYIEHYGGITLNYSISRKKNT